MCNRIRERCSKRELRFGVIGCGLMGREFASAAARWCHVQGLNVKPVITAVCDMNPRAMEWFRQHVPSVVRAVTDYRELLSDPEIDAIYCAVPHNLHETIYTDIIRAGKHLLGEKPFGIDKKANDAIMQAVREHLENTPRIPSSSARPVWTASSCTARVPTTPSGLRMSTRPPWEAPACSISAIRP